MRTIKELRRRTGGALAVLTLVGGGLLFGPEAASAQVQGTCIQDVWKAHGKNNNLTCTANDVTLSSATNINVTAGGSCDPVTGVCRCFAGQMVTFSADFRMDLIADTRYDVGFYLAIDGDPNQDGALTGQCSAAASLAGNTPAGNFINLDAAPDVCGDITGNTDHNPLFVRAQVTTQCPTGAGQQLQLPFATTWRQPGSNEVCSGTGTAPASNDVFPGAPSKCNDGILAINIFSAPVEFTVTKTALTTTVPETGGAATYSVTVRNDSTVAALTLTSLTDNPYGDITQLQGSVTQTDCAVPQTIATSGTYACQFTATVPPGNTGGTFTDVVQACGSNIANPTAVCKTDDATVTYSDVPQAPSLVKAAISAACQIDVNYTVVVTNNAGNDPTPGVLTLNTLTDTHYGSITAAHAANTSCTGSSDPGVCKQVVSTTCAAPQEIAAAGNYSCSFVGRITSCNITEVNRVTGGATDADGASYTPSDTATVTVTVTPDGQ